MSYRPEGFDESLNKALEKLRSLLELPESGKKRDELMASIGADAMLEALKGNSCKYTARELWDVEALHIPESEDNLDRGYYLIAIPEEQNDHANTSGD